MILVVYIVAIFACGINLIILSFAIPSAIIKDKQKAIRFYQPSYIRINWTTLLWKKCQQLKILVFHI